MANPCASSLPILGERARLALWTPITASAGFAVSEVGRIYVPPSNVPLVLEVDAMVAATTTSQTADVTVIVSRAASVNLLTAVGGRRYQGVPAVGDYGNFGIPVKFSLMPPDGQTWPPGDYVVAAQRGANAAQFGGTDLAPGYFWWHR